MDREEEPAEVCVELVVKFWASIVAMVDKNHILSEIKRTAAENGGVPLGVTRFREAAQIRDAEWFGKHWKNWGEALVEAGFPPNEMTSAYEEGFIVKALIDLTREIGTFPVKAELLLKRRRDPAFPSDGVFRRFGSKSQRITKVLEYCREHEGYDDVIEILASLAVPRTTIIRDENTAAIAKSGFVYLIRHGSRREYKIGRTNNQFRREGELSIELPEKVAPVHVIETDDPSGVEKYWHLRFAKKRKNGEWFELAAEDVRAFKRWRRIF